MATAGVGNILQSEKFIAPLPSKDGEIEVKQNGLPQ
jgi:hypothetical protein